MLATLKNMLYGANGGLTNSNYYKDVKRNSFSDYLPYYVTDPFEEVFVHQDQSSAICFECTPVGFAGEDIYLNIEGLLRIEVPEDSVLQFFLYGDPRLDSLLDAYEAKTKRPSPLLKRFKKEIRAEFEKGIHGLKAMQGTPVRNMRLFVSLRVFEQEVNWSKIKTNMQELLKSAHLSPRELDPNDFLEFISNFFNDRRLPQKRQRDQNIPLNKQIIFSETEIEDRNQSLKIGEKHFYCLSPKQFPRKLNPVKMNRLIGGIEGIISDNAQILTPFIFSYNVVFKDLKSQIKNKCNLILMQSMNRKSASAGMLEENKKQRDYLIASDEVENNIPYFKITPLIWVFSDDEKLAKESQARLKTIWENQGFIMQEETYILKTLLLQSLPMGFDTDKSLNQFLQRDWMVPIYDAALLAPIQADFMGNGIPAMLFTARKGQVVPLDVLDKKTSTNMNALVTAGSGSGKSFLINYFTTHYYANGAKIRIIDIGGSYKKMGKMLGAKYLEFTPPKEDEFDEKGNLIPNNEEVICLNPFSSISKAELLFDIGNVANVLGLMAYANETDKNLSQSELVLLKQAANFVYQKSGNNGSIDEVQEFLKNETKDLPPEIKNIAQTLAFNLEDFTTKGVYGRYFNGESTFDISKDDFVILELEQLKGVPDLFNVVVSMVVNSVTQDLYLSDRSCPRMIIFDEAWQFLSDANVIQNIIEEGYRRARKYEGSFWVITQSLMDLPKFGKVGDVLKSNSSYKFLLASKDFKASLDSGLIDYDEFTMKILKTVQTNRPNYSEIFLETDKSFGVIRLNTNRFVALAATSDGEEVNAIERLVEQGLSYETAIDKMIEQETAHAA